MASSHTMLISNGDGPSSCLCLLLHFFFLQIKDYHMCKHFKNCILGFQKMISRQVYSSGFKLWFRFWTSDFI